MLAIFMAFRMADLSFSCGSPLHPQLAKPPVYGELSVHQGTSGAGTTFSPILHKGMMLEVAASLGRPQVLASTWLPKPLDASKMSSSDVLFGTILLSFGL